MKNIIAKIRSLMLSLKHLIATIAKSVTKGRKARKNSLQHVRRSLSRVSFDLRCIRKNFRELGGSYHWVGQTYDLWWHAKRRHRETVKNDSNRLRTALEQFVEKLESLLEKPALLAA